MIKKPGVGTEAAEKALSQVRIWFWEYLSQNVHEASFMEGESYTPEYMPTNYSVVGIKFCVGAVSLSWLKARSRRPQYNRYPRPAAIESSGKPEGL